MEIMHIYNDPVISSMLQLRLYYVIPADVHQQTTALVTGSHSTLHILGLFTHFLKTLKTRYLIESRLFHVVFPELAINLHGFNHKHMKHTIHSAAYIREMVCCVWSDFVRCYWFCLQCSYVLCLLCLRCRASTTWTQETDYIVKLYAAVTT